MTADRPEFHPADVYELALPERPRPIVLLGAGGIVRDAHLPAYMKAGFDVAAIYNRTKLRARALADRFGIPLVVDSVKDAVAAAPADAVFDLALMPEQYLEVLEALPDRAAVLIQKPLGNDLRTAGDILSLCHRKNLTAAVNTQLRFTPYIAEARRFIASGAIGELIDLEVRVSVKTPWERFPHAAGLDRLEINAHSVHYLDLIRSFLGNPDGVSAVTVRHPLKELANTRSEIILRYRDRPLRVVVSTNHDHAYGPAHEESFIKWEGTHGVVRAQMGLLLDYPRGGADALEAQLLADNTSRWSTLPFSGSWFPDAFIGSMSALQRYLEGSVPSLPTSVDDVFDTMAVVEAAYESSDREGIAIQRYDGP